MGLLGDFLSGGVGGFSLLVAGHPFDTIKVRCQTQPEIYKSGVQALRYTLANESPWALYKGITALLPGVAFVFALSFTGYEHGKQIFGMENKGQLAMAGFWSAIYTTPLIGPGERVKCVAQTTNKYGTGSLEILKNLYKEGGFRTMTKGMGWTLARDGFGGALYYGIYETLKQRYFKANNTTTLPMAQTISYGGFTGMAMWSVVLPIDTVKSRIQTAPEGVSGSAVIKQVMGEVKSQGPKVVYRGLGPTLARAFPANAACFTGYETAKKFFSKFNI